MRISVISEHWLGSSFVTGGITRWWMQTVWCGSCGHTQLSQPPTALPLSPDPERPVIVTQHLKLKQELKGKPVWGQRLPSKILALLLEVGVESKGAGGVGVAQSQPILTHNLLSCDLPVFSPQGSTYSPTPNSFFLQLQFSLISHKLFKEWSCHQGADLGCPSQHGASRSQALNIFCCQTVGAAQSLKRNSQWHQRIPAHKPAMRVVAYAKCFTWVLQYQKC